MTTPLEAALTWHNLGIATIPLLARDKRPALDGWRRYQSEMPRLRDLNMWFGSGRYNIAVLCGWRGLVVLDFDDEDVCDHWSDLTPAPDTYQVTTSRGRHLYYYCREDTECVKGPGWDVKAAGGYVVGVPSIHPSGHQYHPFMYWEPGQIATIQSIWNLIEKPDPPMPLTHSTPSDPWAIAMRPDSNGPSSSIAEVKARLTLHQLLGLPHNGRRHMLQCPLPGHDDENASFAVFADDRFYCFGCQRYGDVLDFVALRDGLTVAEALRLLTNS
jgi:hypothetical protein